MQKLQVFLKVNALQKRKRKKSPEIYFKLSNYFKFPNTFQQSLNSSHVRKISGQKEICG